MGQSIKRVGCGGLAIAVCMAGMGLPGLAYAQAAGAESAAAAAFASEVSDAALPAAIIPALTPVSLRIEQELGSKISHSGDAFRISLALPIVIEGTELVPAGVEGLGEVVHAKKGGLGGAAGELVLAARYLEVDGRHLDLRSLAFLGRGKDNMDLTAAVGIAAGFPALLISGGNTVVPSGAIVTAKTREAFVLNPLPVRQGDKDSSVKEGVNDED